MNIVVKVTYVAHRLKMAPPIGSNSVSILSPLTPEDRKTDPDYETCLLSL
jgi:hypothetical protein